MITVDSIQPYRVYFCISTALTSAGHGTLSDAAHFETFEARKYRLQSLSKLTWNPNIEFYLHPYLFGYFSHELPCNFSHELPCNFSQENYIQTRILIFFGLHELYQY